MNSFHLNVWAYLAAVASNYVIGGLWYSPMLFLKPWMKIAKVSESQMKAGFPRAMLGDLAGSAVMAFVLLQTIQNAGVQDLGQGLWISFLCWLGFIVAVQIGTVTHENRPFKFFAINTGYRLITLLVMGAVLTVWK